MGRNAATTRYRVAAGLVVIGLGLLPAAGRALADEGTCPKDTSVSIGVESGTTAPFTFSKDADGATARKLGIDIDVISALKRALKSSCGEARITVQQAPFEQLFDRLTAGQFDLLVSAITINAPAKERKGVTYSIPYYGKAGLVLAYPKDTEIAKALRKDRAHWRQALKTGSGTAGKEKVTVYVKKGTTSQTFAKTDAASWEVKAVRVPNAESLFARAGTGEGRLVLFDAPAVRYLLCGADPRFSELARGWAILGEDGKDGCEAPRHLTREQYGVAVRADDVDTLRWVNLALYNLLKDPREVTGEGEWETAVNQWFARDEAELDTCEDGTPKGRAPRCFQEAEAVETAGPHKRRDPLYKTVWNSLKVSASGDWSWSNSDTRERKLELAFDVLKPSVRWFGREPVRAFDFTYVHVDAAFTDAMKDSPPPPKDNKRVKEVHAGPRFELCVFQDACKTKVTTAVKPVGWQKIRQFDGTTQETFLSSYELSAGLEWWINRAVCVEATWTRSGTYPIFKPKDTADLVTELVLKLSLTPAKLF
jgi:ABC-type amino acid transport substrate-binding protein